MYRDARARGISQFFHFVNRIYIWTKTRYTAQMDGLPPQLDKIFAELARREQAGCVLSHYAAYALDVLPAKHHVLICQAIDELLDDEYDELIINSPPGSAKSTYTSHALPAAFMGRFPTKNVILATHTSDLSERWSRKVRNTVDSKTHNNIYPDSKLSHDSTAVSRWATSKGGEVLAAGVGGSILGFRADLGILDDPISGYEQAQSLTQLQKIHSWYETDFVTRLKPGAKVVLICQRLSPNDLAGYLIQRNALNPTKRQRVLILPMEAEEDDPLGRMPGERLWPEWYTPEMVEDAKRDEFKWKTLYQQKPPSETGSWVASEEIKLVDIVPSALHRYTLTDLALSVNSGDYSVHITAGVDSKGDVYVEDAWRDRCAIEATVKKHIDLCENQGIQLALIDDDNMAKVYVQLLAVQCRERGVIVPLKMLPMRGQNKETRAAPLRGLFKSGKIFFKRGPWNRWLINEILAFPNAMGDGVDDGIDALGLIGRRLASLGRPAAPPQAAPPPKFVQQATLNEMWEDRERNFSARRRV